MNFFDIREFHGFVVQNRKTMCALLKTSTRETTDLAAPLRMRGVGCVNFISLTGRQPLSTSVSKGIPCSNLKAKVLEISKSELTFYLRNNPRLRFHLHRLPSSPRLYKFWTPYSEPQRRPVYTVTNSFNVHEGIPDNELADRLAQESRQLQTHLLHESKSLLYNRNGGDLAHRELIPGSSGPYPAACYLSTEHRAHITRLLKTGTSGKTGTTG